MKTKNQTLTFVLLKKEIGDFEDALKSPNELTQRELAKSIPYDGELYVASQQRSKAAWIDFVKPGIVGGVGSLQTASVSAVLFVKAGGRTFAVIFGYGRHLLLKDSYETRFGLKVVANKVDVTKLRSVDTLSLRAPAPGKPPLRTRKRAPLAADLDHFAVPPRGEQVCALAGKPEDTAFAKRIAGSDWLTIFLPIQIEDLGKKCEELLKAYRSKKYVDHFPGIDDIQ